MITVYGNATYNRIEKKLHFNSPLYFLSDKSKFLEELKGIIKNKNFQLNYKYLPVFAISIAVFWYNY